MRIKPPLVKTLVSSIIAISAGVAVATAIAAPGGHGPGKGHERGSKIKDPEVRAEKMFERLDADGSGVVTIDEFMSRPGNRATRHFERLDVNEDSSLSPEEFLDHPRRHDGDIDHDAVRACVEEALGEELPERPEPEAVFADMDANGDGAVSEDEFLGAAESRASDRFARVDADGDGGITLEELLAAVDTRTSHRDIRRQCVEEQRAADELTGG
jgi:Ca2+-binding EF-hand superfamily protein